MDSTFQLLHSTLGDRMMASDFQGKFFSTWNCRCKWSLAWESRIKSFQTCHGSEYLFPISTMFGSTIESEEIIQKQDTEKNISIWDFLLLLNKILFNSFCISAYRLAFFRIMLTNEIREPGLKNASHFIINNKLKRYKEEMETHFSLFFFFFFWLHWVFVAARRLSLVVASQGYSSLWCMGFSLQWLLLLQSTVSRRTGFSSCSMWAQ